MDLSVMRDIRCERLLLRRFVMDDAEVMFRAWAADVRVTRYMSWDTHADVGVSRAVVRSWLDGYRDGDPFNWAVEYDGALIGSVGAAPLDAVNESAEAGYCFAYDYWGRGFATEALRAMTAFLFEEVGLHRVWLRHDVRNEASGHVMRKCGYRKEGVAVESQKSKDGTFADMATYAMLRKEFMREG